MNERLTWEQAPAVLVKAVESKLGPIRKADTVLGRRPGLAARVYGADDDAFIKAIPLGTPAAWFYQREQQATTLMQSWSPAPILMWELMTDDWLLLAIELVNDHARHVDLRPGSADIDPTLNALHELSIPLPEPRPQTAAEWYRAKWAKAEHMLNLSADKVPSRNLYEQAVEGFDFKRLETEAPTLIHADLSRRNLLIKDRRVVAVDWSTWCIGAWWIMPATMAPAFIAEGHQPWEVDVLLGGVSTLWRSVPAAEVAGLAAVQGLLHLERAMFGPAERQADFRLLAEASRKWMTYRLG
ncbi:phosphotransferase [Nonomuraea sp. NPDC049421]|uniref:phosphotransferase n=1 Tax=Nonomuraea sp. NPDC049421 TaxID=3155275 RepID=UPI003430E58E